MMRTPDEIGEVVYGVDGLTGRAVFLARPEAEAFQRLGRLQTARTWGEVRAVLPLNEYLDVKSIYGFDDDRDPGASDPPDDEAFSIRSVATYSEGEWPVALMYRSGHVLPPDVAAQFGDDMGDYVEVRAEDVERVADAMRARGYRLTRDDGLVRDWR